MQFLIFSFFIYQKSNATPKKLIKEDTNKRKSSFPQWVRRKSLAFTQSMHGHSGFAISKKASVSLHPPLLISRRGSASTSMFTPSRGFFTSTAPTPHNIPRVSTRRMSTSCDWKPPTRVINRRPPMPRHEFTEELDEQDEENVLTPFLNENQTEPAIRTQSESDEGQLGKKFEPSTHQKGMQNTELESSDIECGRQHRAKDRSGSIRRSVTSSQSERRSADDDRSSVDSYTRSHDSSITPRPVSSLHGAVSTEKRFSVVHEVKALSPGNSLSGVFYCSSVISRKNSSSSGPGGAGLTNVDSSHLGSDQLSNQPPRVQRRRTLNLPKQSSPTRTPAFYKQHSIAAVCPQDDVSDTSATYLQTVGLVEQELSGFSNQADQNTASLSGTDTDLPSTGTGADQLAKPSPGYSGRASVQSEPRQYIEALSTQDAIAERPCTAEPQATSPRSSLSRRSTRFTSRTSCRHRRRSPSIENQEESSKKPQVQKAQSFESKQTPKSLERKFCVYFRWSDWMSVREEYSLFLFSPENALRRHCSAITEHRCFDYVVLIFISLNCITLAMERPKIPPWSAERELLNAANYVFTFVFALEMALKVLASGLWYSPTAYFRSGWNIMDGILVGVSLFDLVLSMIAQRSPRILGILRVFRLLRSLRPLR